MLSNILVVLLLFASSSAMSEVNSQTGTYLLKWSEDSGCELKTEKISDSNLRFELSCNGGKPSYNSGLALGQIKIKNNVATYKRQVSGLCEIRFLFNNKGVEVSQKGIDAVCGFGFGIYSGGIYTLKNHKTPIFKYK